MSINKRYIIKDTILRYKNDVDICYLINADAVIMDSWSSNFYKYFDFGYKNFNKFRSNQIELNQKNITPDIPKGLSNILIKLINEPNEYDIYFCEESFKILEIEYETNKNNNFDELVEYFKNKIIKFYGY